MSQSNGEKLRLAREARGIALREISEQTRISIRYLEAIETDDYKRLPGGIFNRSFIRAYAKFIDYDAHQSLVYTEDGGSGSRSSVKTLILAILILAALSLAVWGGLEWYKRRTGQTPGPPGTGRLVKYQTDVAASSTGR